MVDTAYSVLNSAWVISSLSDFIFSNSERYDLFFVFWSAIQRIPNQVKITSLLIMVQ